MSVCRACGIDSDVEADKKNRRSLSSSDVCRIILTDIALSCSQQITTRCAEVSRRICVQAGADPGFFWGGGGSERAQSMREIFKATPTFQRTTPICMRIQRLLQLQIEKSC